MSVEESKTDILQQTLVENMSAVTQKPVEELRPSIPAFSYAQAAKGKAVVGLSPSPAGKALSDTTEVDVKRTALSENENIDSEKSETPAKRTASEGRAPREDSFKLSTEADLVKSGQRNEHKKSDMSNTRPNPAPQSHPTISTPSSPDFGTTSTSTLPKEEDNFSTANGSSDSTWDKQSQTSQNGIKSNEKVEGDKEPTQSAASAPWDEEKPANVSLKEAPPPAVNFWQQRMAQAPKPKSQQTRAPPEPKPATLTNGNSNSQAKAVEAAVEPKKQESKKKAKSSSEDRPGMKEGTKSADGKGRTGGEGPPKANVATVAPPPPPGDSISWPTPDSALGEEKKKTQEHRGDKGDKEKPQATKPHGRKEWERVAYVPNAVFNTPIPQGRRGGRPPGGGTRENTGRSRNANNIGSGGEKSISNTASPTSHAGTSTNERGITALGPAAQNVNPPKTKRASSAGPSTVREQRKMGETTGIEKRKESDVASTKANQSRGSVGNESRKQSGTIVADLQHFTRPTDPSLASEAAQALNRTSESYADDESQRHHVVSDAHAHTRNGGSERRSDGSNRPLEAARDLHGSVSTRERGEGRAERGRGGFRGRGGGNHNYYNSNLANGHGYPNNHPSQYQSTAGPQSRSYSNHERLPSQGQGLSYSGPQQQPRNFRSNSRSQSIAHSAPYGRFPNGPHAGPPHLANLQTDLANNYGFQPGSQGIMSAVPYNPYMDPVSLASMVKTQMEYYFSLENLCKDIFFRKQMDSQGFVFLSVVANFNRIKLLTTDMELIRYVCMHSYVMELRTGEDGVDRLRRRDEWQQWVLKMEDRDPSAQNAGPAQPLPQISQFYEAPHTFDDRHGSSPRSNGINGSLDNVQYQSIDGIAPSFGPVTVGPLPTPHGTYQSATQTPLSAAVSEFSPSARSTNNRGLSTPDSHAQGTNIFTDEQVDNLNILVRKPFNAAAPMVPPFHSMSSRTFSNGSIDGTTIHDELANFAEYQSRPTLNGDGPDSTNSSRVGRSRSPFALGSPGRVDNSVSPPVFWIKDKEKEARFDSLPNELMCESYHVFRRDALSEREQMSGEQCSFDMQNLYQFWAHFLIRNFNVRMYEEFRKLAIEDSTQRKSTTGKRCLMQYYNEALLGQKVIPDDNIASHFVELVKGESSDSDRPAFKKLRAAWRNGAFNHKNRAKIIKVIDTELREELDR